MSKRVNVLLVEDDKDYRTLLSILIKKLDMNVTVVEDVVQAFALLESGPRIDIVVTDYQLSGTSGVQLVAALRESNYNMPVVLISAVRSFSNAEIGTFGIAAFLEKPFSADLLKETLERVLVKSG